MLWKYFFSWNSNNFIKLLEKRKLNLNLKWSWNSLPVHYDKIFKEWLTLFNNALKKTKLSSVSNNLKTKKPEEKYFFSIISNKY